MPIKAKLTKQEFEALDGEARKSYELAGEVAYFTGEIPDVTGLQTALDNERALHTRATDQLKAYTGIDPVKAKAALAAQKPSETVDLDKLPANIKAALEQMNTSWEEKFKKKDDEAKELLTDRTIESVLSKAGVIPKALPYAVDAVKKLVRPLDPNEPTVLGVLGPGDKFIGTDFETWAGADFKKDFSWFFLADASGGTGSKGNNRGVDTTGAVIKVDREASKLNPALYRQAKEQAEKTGASVDLGDTKAA